MDRRWMEDVENKLLKLTLKQYANYYINYYNGIQKRRTYYNDIAKR